MCVRKEIAERSACSCKDPVVHQVGWIATSPESVFVSKTQTSHDSALSVYRPDEVDPEEGQSWLFQTLTIANYMMPEIDQSQAWNSAPNAESFRTILPEAICLSQGNPIWSPDGFGLSHHAGNPNVFASKSPLRFRDFDSLGGTVFSGEVNAAFVPWGDPDNLRSLEFGVDKQWRESKRGSVGYGSVHPGGAHVLMGDGAVRFIDDHIDLRVLGQLGERQKD